MRTFIPEISKALVLVMIGMLTPFAGVLPERAAAQERSAAFLRAGEVLQYKVRWNFLRLGTIILRTVRDTASSDTSQYRLLMIVESNPDLMVVRIREFNESIVQRASLTSLRYRGKHRRGDDLREITYSYDPETRRAACVERDCRSRTILEADTLEDVPPYVEGASLLFYSRSLLHCRAVVKVPTMVGGKLSSTMLDFTGGVEETEVEGVDLPVRCRKYTGYADWSGGSSAGVSGSFTGWMSDDTAAIPLRAEMHVLLGSITVDLEKWDRPGWNPPPALRAASQ